ncbi:succinate dehydrogenase/fumarate reductase cytochrome b subunit [Deltaproteobacteria bacterium]|nr:succinate dehydrogenase/fumarate reductase cytochrome b subunit [Deltaproteobacteria bacterium]
MTTNSTIHIGKTVRTAAYLDWIQMLTGAGLILFMWTHMILVASVNFGPEIMDSIAWFFEYTYMAQVGGPMIGVAFFVHFFAALRKIPFRIDEFLTFWRHSRMLRHTDTWLWMAQVFTAVIILIMGSIHMWTVLTDLPITAAKSAARVQHWSWLFFYLLLLPMVELHVGIGFYRIGVKWGFVGRKTRKPFKTLENILTAFFILIGLITIIRFLTLPV